MLVTTDQIYNNPCDELLYELFTVTIVQMQHGGRGGSPTVWCGWTIYIHIYIYIYSIDF